MTQLHDRSLLRQPENPSRNGIRIAAKLLLILALVMMTNWGFGDRVGLLVDNSRYGTLIPYVAIWGVALLAIVVAAFQPNVWVRLFWTVLIAVSSAAAWGYHRASQSEFTVFDIVSLWNARHEAGRAAEFYGQFIWPALVLLAASILLLGLPVAVTGRLSLWLKRLFWFPAVPVALIAVIVFMKGGGGSQAMPSQFTPVALTTLAGAKIALHGAPPRQGVAWQPSAAPRQNIVILVDESIRYDYLDLTPGNPHTPNLAALAPRFVNFGPAVSGGNCSNYANAILRYAASRKNVAATINTNPTIWQFAKKAGYRTVFIDAQAGGITNPGLLQNFMSLSEKGDIDAFHAIRDVASSQADMTLADIVAAELRAGGPVFIYANKNGAHFPYDHAYPESQTRYSPTMTEAGAMNFIAKVASYRNAVSWSVDDFMAKLFSVADFSGTTLVYTSDHAQNLNPQGITHCQVENPDPRMALVPLMVATTDLRRRTELQDSAAERFGTVSHFQIMPSVLAWMGYHQEDLAKVYDESLTSGQERQPAFTSGDVFGLFSDDVHWTPVDTSIDYLEPPARDLQPSSQAIEGAQG